MTEAQRMMLALGISAIIRAQTCLVITVTAFTACGAIAHQRGNRLPRWWWEGAAWMWGASAALSILGIAAAYRTQ